MFNNIQKIFFKDTDKFVIKKEFIGLMNYDNLCFINYIHPLPMPVSRNGQGIEIKITRSAIK